MNHSIDRNRFEELVAGEVLEDLSIEEQAELDVLKREPEYVACRGELESTLGRVQLALLDQESTLPTELRMRIVADATNHVISEHRDAPVTMGAPRGSESRSDVSQVEQEKSSAPFGYREAVAWIACAAAILVAIGLRSPKVEKPIQLTSTDMRTALLFDADDVVSADWAEGRHPFDTEVKGDVVWSGGRQEGYMRFVGMPVNDPSVEQYQLWIIDPERDDEPIDGGVFDVRESGEIIVPIDAKLGVVAPAAFAITIEKPGGVVVSTQERLPLLAPVGT